jgi:hypothetical protein
LKIDENQGVQNSLSELHHRAHQKGLPQSFITKILHNKAHGEAFLQCQDIIALRLSFAQICEDKGSGSDSQFEAARLFRSSCTKVYQLVPHIHVHNTVCKTDWEAINVQATQNSSGQPLSQTKVTILHVFFCRETVARSRTPTGPESEASSQTPGCGAQKSIQCTLPHPEGLVPVEIEYLHVLEVLRRIFFELLKAPNPGLFVCLFGISGLLRVGVWIVLQDCSRSCGYFDAECFQRNDDLQFTGLRTLSLGLCKNRHEILQKQGVERDQSPA